MEEVNKLEWVSINDNFFDMNKYAGEGNIGHIIEEIRIDLSNTKIDIYWKQMLSWKRRGGIYD